MDKQFAERVAAGARIVEGSKILAERRLEKEHPIIARWREVEVEQASFGR